jgi:hypothetical protein
VQNANSVREKPAAACYENDGSAENAKDASGAKR